MTNLPLEAPPRSLKIIIDGNIENRNCYSIRLDYDHDNEEKKELEEEEEKYGGRGLEEEVEDDEKDEKVYKILTKRGRFISLVPIKFYFY